MAGVSYFKRVTQALELLRDGLKPFAARELEAAYGDGWLETCMQRHNYPQDVKRTFSEDGGDLKIVLEIMWDFWNDVFRRTLGHDERSLVSEMRGARNRWAHNETFNSDDAYRVMDSAERLLKAISAKEAKQIAEEKAKIMREKFAQETRDDRKKAKSLALEGQPLGHLKPWRQVVTPHKDVASGLFAQAEFAADLAQVVEGKASSEYADPIEFFRRTYMTEGLTMLLSNALNHLCKTGADPVMELQTNFGGGKTHSMLALYHLFSGELVAKLRGADELAAELKITEIPTLKRAVLVGTALSPAEPKTKDDGTVVKTLWGELAWQLLGKAGFEMVANADREGVSPGSDVLRELFRKTDGCLILIDEWVAYVRQLYRKDNLAGGSFEANITFAQSLTEAVKAVPRTLLVASLPASKIEIGGDGGEHALEQLRHTFSRVDSPWRPASAEESYEIVRRRLFNELESAERHRERDAVVDAYFDLYRQHATDFPSECREADYKRKMQSCYPFHPELFERLFNEWSSLDKFQRTRGILRLMAKVIHHLWDQEDDKLMIMPANIPIYASEVQSELTRYLEDGWVAVIERDIDGANSTPRRLDKENPSTLGRFGACRRVARVIYMASAPIYKSDNRGTDDKRILLACVQPGETLPTFGDAIRRLNEKAVYLYSDGTRYWYSTTPTVKSLAKDRAAQLKADVVEMEIRKRLQGVFKRPGQFARLLVCPSDGADIADEESCRLVVLDADKPFSGNGKRDSQAKEAAEALLMNRGQTPRQNRNTLVFLAADQRQLDGVLDVVRTFLAWQSIVDDQGAEGLNLDPQSVRVAETARKEASDTADQRIIDAWQCILAPYQEKTTDSTIQWQELKPRGDGGPADRVANALIRQELLFSQLAGTRLLLELDKVPLWEGNHVAVSKLREYFARYLYLPRLLSPELLKEAIEDGARLISWEQDTFAYADGWDEKGKRYQGLRAGTNVRVDLMGSGFLVKRDVAKQQMMRDQQATEVSSTQGVGQSDPGKDQAGVVPGIGEAGLTKPTDEPQSKVKRRFFGTVELDPEKLTTSVGTVHDEVVQHLQSLVDAHVKIVLDIQVEVPDGIPDTVYRIVNENCNTLKFTQHDFEEE